MKREIKFRGKRFYNNKWVYGNLFIDKDGERYILENAYLEQDGHHLVCNSDTPVFMMEETIGQYTGLKDKNGMGLTEVFEGDIISEDGILKGNIYENDKRETDIVVPQLGTKDWETTYKEIVVRGYDYSE